MPVLQPPEEGVRREGESLYERRTRLTVEWLNGETDASPGRFKREEHPLALHARTSRSACGRPSTAAHARESCTVKG